MEEIKKIEVGRSDPQPPNLGGSGKYIFEARMEVRDYECDIEGIVNNANYLHYTEHTRHLFLKHCGLSFAEMHEKGVDRCGSYEPAIQDTTALR